VTEITPIRRRRRADADRSAEAVLRAAKQVFATHPHASVEDVAAAAGVTRQTVYAHFKNRDALLGAVIDQITAEAVGEMDAARLDEGPASQALLRLLDASWRTIQRYPQLMNAAPKPQADDGRHHAVADHLHRLLTRGRQAGEFAADLDTAWLATAVVVLGHAAGEAVNAGRMTIDEAKAALATSVLRVCGARAIFPDRPLGPVPVSKP